MALASAWLAATSPLPHRDGEDAVGAELRGGARQGLEEIADEQVIGRRYAIRMRGYPAVEYIDIATLQLTAEMIVGASIAEAELQHVARPAGDHLRSMVETGALRPADG
jgi:hypothetical protein